MTTKAVAFDFDGVFVRDSDAVFKIEAWDSALAPWAGRYKPMLDEGRSIFGEGKKGGRLEILEYVFEKLGEPQEKIPALVAQAAKDFDEHVQNRIAEAGFVPGALEMLQELSKLGIALYINSGTVTTALETSTKNLTIRSFFKGILGSLKSKADNLRDITAREGIGSSAILVVGDGDSDYQAAQEAGCRFLGVANKWNKWRSGEKNFPVVTDLRDVKDYI